jgi:hypothetical protein
MSSSTGAVPEFLDYSLVEPSLRGAIAVGGSTGAIRIEYDARPYIYKYAPPKNVVNEFVAFKLYAAAGARVPQVHLVINTDAGGIPQGVLIQYIEGATVAEALHKSLLTFGERYTLLASIKTDFLLHALFANWDAINSENYIIAKSVDGKYDVNEPYIIDLGGALFYRAMGEPKSSRFFSSLDINEIDTIPNESSTTSARLFVIPEMEDLRDPHILKRNLCSRLAKLDKDAILAEVRRFEEVSLFSFYPAGFELKGILGGRLSLFKDYCAKGRLLKSITAAVARIEGTPSVYNQFRTNIVKTEKFDAMAESYRAMILESMKEDVVKPLSLRGARSVVEPGGITAEEAAGILLHAKPTRSVRRGGAGAAWNGNDNYNFDEASSEPAAPYPTPPMTIMPALKHKVLAPRTDPKLQKWLEEQTAFLQTRLTSRERDILVSYTRHGDRLVNNYLRRTLRESLKELIAEIIDGPDAYPTYSVPLAYSLLDQVDTLMREKRHLLRIPDDWPTGQRISVLLRTDSVDVNMRAVTEFMAENLTFFSTPRHIESLLTQYVRDLFAIMKKAPPPPHTFTVFRGIAGDSYLRELDFRTVDFMSSSLSPDTVIERFLTRTQNLRVSRQYVGSVYEMEVRPQVPCIYMEALTQYPGEYEILIAPGVVVETDDKIYLKYYNRDPAGVLQIQRESAGKDAGTFVSVVECLVRVPKAAEKSGQLIYLGDMRSRAVGQDVSERFSADKPRGERAGRGHKKRITWKSERRKGNLRKTRRGGSGS